MAVAPNAKEKQKSEELKSNAPKLEIPVAGFIPYACHYDKDTILTKNGELLQTIEIKGFSHAKNNEATNIRQQIRKAVLETIKFPRFAIYFHTIRRAMNLDDGPKFSSYFSQKVHDSWVKSNTWDRKHVNNLYITIIIEGIKLNFPTFLKSPLINSIIEKHNKILIETHKELNSVTSEILKKTGCICACKVRHEKKCKIWLLFNLASVL